MKNFDEYRKGYLSFTRDDKKIFKVNFKISKFAHLRIYVVVNLSTIDTTEPFLFGCPIYLNGEKVYD